MFLRMKNSLLGALGSILSVFLMYHILKLSIKQEYTRYLDSTEITNYTLLESLLLSGAAASNPASNSMSDNIHLTLDELKHLASLSTITTTSTIIIQYESISTLSIQLDAIKNQKNFKSPIIIHIVCQTIQDQYTVQDFVQLSKIKYNISVNKEDNWFNHIQEINTEFVIILNKQVIPGQGYFHFILSLLNTPQFDYKLIGTEQENINICQQDEAHYVESIKNVLVLRSNWYLEKQISLLPSIILPTSVMDNELHGNTKSSCVNVSMGGILFYGELNHLTDLICQFGEKQQQQRDVIHLVTLGDSSKQVLPTCHQDDIIMIHHSVINQQELDRLIYKISPSVVIYEKKEDDVETLKDAFHVTTDITTWIGLPTKDIPLVSLWIADLSIESLKQWHKPQINLIVATGGKRFKQLKSLFKSITKAHYLGDNNNIQLSIVMDEKSEEKTIQYVNNNNWKFGIKNVRHRISGAHPMQIFSEAWYPTSNDEYAVMLDDKIELSDCFYIWLKYNLLKYRYEQSQQQQNQQIFGISLYSPRILDTDPSGRRQLSLGKIKTNYLMQIPCSLGGALYFPEHWREFHDYITARLTDQSIVKRGSNNQHLFKDSLLTISKSNKWINSWRKYFDELIYMRGYIMLYPNINNSYSTIVTLSATTATLKKHQELYSTAEKIYKVPLSTKVLELPNLELLPIFDLHGKLSSRELLLKKGHELQRKFSACEPIINHQYDPSDLLCPFNHLIQVPIDQKSIPIKTIHLLG